MHFALTSRHQILWILENVITKKFSLRNTLIAGWQRIPRGRLRAPGELNLEGDPTAQETDS